MHVYAHIYIVPNKYILGTYVHEHTPALLLILNWAYITVLLLVETLNFSKHAQKIQR